AEQALAANDLAAAVRLAGRAVDAGAEPVARGTARAVQAEAHRWRSEFAEALRFADEAMTLLPPSDPRWHGAAAVAAASAGNLGLHERLVALAEQLLGLERMATPAGALACAVQLFYAGRTELAAALIDRIEQQFGARSGFERDLIYGRGRAAFARGDMAGYLRSLGDLVGAHEAAGDLRNACQARGNLGYASAMVGRYAAAEEHLRRAIADAERIGLPYLSVGARLNLALALAERGQHAEAERLARACLEFYTARALPRLAGFTRAYLALIMLRAGRAVEAEAEARAATGQDAAPSARAYGLALLATALLAQGRATEARAAAIEAVALGESLGTLEEGDGQIRLADVETRRAVGDAEGAAGVQAEARRRLLATADRFEDADVRRSFLEQVPAHASLLAF
ncbi:MAG TPA: tetratricopeptide repeat protein, partial [Kofleriaceae bacterium]|nr:tetratricopeptide repeat protein [Kofleriaceae bacterium]